MNSDFDRDRRPFEMIVNTVSSGLGLALAVAGLPLLIVCAARDDTAWPLVGVTIYGAALVFAYLAFTLYHLFKGGSRHRLFKIFDHAAIYLLIAGTYTPFTLVNLRGHGGWILFGVIWGLAILGVVFKVFCVHRFRIVAPLLYVAMGWLIVFAIKPALTYIPIAGIWLLLAGGVLYTGGLIFYALERIPYHHAIWHLFVIGGSVCHFLAVLRAVALPMS